MHWSTKITDLSPEIRNHKIPCALNFSETQVLFLTKQKLKYILQ
jgi:hypothetical protein